MPTALLRGFLVALPMALAALGQASEGSLLGTVVDSSGNSLAGAQVTVTSLQNNAQRRVLTDRSGEYIVANLPAGFYRVEVALQGFKKLLQSRIKIEIQDRLRADFKLERGAMSELVRSVLSPFLVHTDTPELGGNITSDMLRSLPNLDRNFVEFTALSPGTILDVLGLDDIVSGIPRDTRRDASAAAVIVTGTGSDTNTFILDGISDDTEFSRGINVLPDIDAIQELKLQTAQYSAEFGHAGGGVINVAIKSGTNAIHGFAYDYLSNEKLDARQFFDFDKLPLRGNQFGAGVGGPIVKDRVFFFADYAGVRSLASTQFTGVTSTPLEKTGNFTQSGYTIYDPSTTHANPGDPSQPVRDPFPGNIIPPGRLSPLGAALVNAWPYPNWSYPGISDNYLADETNTANLGGCDLKIDARPTPNDQLSARYSQQRLNRGDSGPWPNNVLGSVARIDGSNAGLAYMRMLSSHLTNDFRMGYNYAMYGNSILNSSDVLDRFDIPGLPNNPASQGFPATTIRNLIAGASTGAIPEYPNPLLVTENAFQWLDSISHQVNTHALKYGIEFARLRNDRIQGLAGNAAVNYSGLYTSPEVGQFLPTGIPDALLDLAQTLETQDVYDKTRLRFWRMDAYFQDYWRYSRKLTFSLGLRYDYDSSYSEQDNRTSNFDFTSGVFLIPKSAEPVVQAYLGTAALPSNFEYVNTDQVVPHANRLNFAPRFGFAYSVFNWLTVRGGYGIFYGVNPASYYSDSGTQSPFFNSLLFNGSQSTPLSLAGGFPSSVLSYLSSPGLTGYYAPLHAHTPYSQKYTVGYDLAITRAAMLEIDYSGERALAFPMISYGNVPLPGAGPIASRREFPAIGTIQEYLPINDSRYTGLEAQFRLRTFHGLSIQSAFDCVRHRAYTSSLDGEAITNPYDFRYDWGNSDYDFPLHWVLGVMYEIPNPKTAPEIIRHLLDNWEISGWFTMQDGLPFTVMLGEDVLNNGLGTNRPDVVGEVNLPVSQQRWSHWFNTSAFALPVEYTYGNEGKNSLHGPGLVTLDFAAQKSISLGDTRRLMVRAQAENILNRPNFGLPGSIFGAPDFGIIRSVATGARQIQLSLRFEL